MLYSMRRSSKQLILFVLCCMLCLCLSSIISTLSKLISLTARNESINSASSCKDIKFSKYAERNFERVWTSYRLADIIFNRSDVGTEVSICRQWPTSVGCQYRMSKTAPRNMSWLIEHYESHGRYLGKYLSNYTILHLRLGDVVRKDYCWEQGCPYFHSKHQAHNYVYPKQYYEDILHAFPRNKQIMIVGNPYHENRDDQVMKNLLYLRKVVCFFRSHGFVVHYFGDDRTPDEDFFALMSATTFIQGGGGYSRMAASILQQRNQSVVFLVNNVTKRNILL